MRLCLNCNEPIINKNARAKYCTDKCNYAFHNKKVSVRRAKIRYTINCLYCGDEYVSRSSKTKFCCIAHTKAWHANGKRPRSKARPKWSRIELETLLADPNAVLLTRTIKATRRMVAKLGLRRTLYRVADNPKLSKPPKSIATATGSVLITASPQAEGYGLLAKLNKMIPNSDSKNDIISEAVLLIINDNLDLESAVKQAKKIARQFDATKFKCVEYNDQLRHSYYEEVD